MFLKQMKDFVKRIYVCLSLVRAHNLSEEKKSMQKIYSRTSYTMLYSNMFEIFSPSKKRNVHVGKRPKYKKYCKNFHMCLMFQVNL